MCVSSAGGHVPRSQELIRRGLKATDVFMTVSEPCSPVISFFGPYYSYYINFHTRYDLFIFLFHPVR
jgi:hypothetical protein